MTAVPEVRAGARRMVRTVRTRGLLVVLSAAVACAWPGAAEAQDPSPCRTMVDKGYPIGWVQYCELAGDHDAWVPVYKAPGWNPIGTEIVGWLTHRGHSNWFWCQITGRPAWNEWRTSVHWAETMSDIDAGPPYRARHRQGWVPQSFFANGTYGLSDGSTLVGADSTLRWC